MPIHATSKNRRWLRTVGGVLIGFVLFAQLAIAAYACQGHALSMADQQRAPCEEMAMGVMVMDTQNANLCAEHCHYGQQSSQASTLTVPAVLLTALYVTPLTSVPLSALRPAATTTSALVAASPPHSILHCCFRI